MGYDPIQAFDSLGANTLLEILHPGSRPDGRTVFPSAWDENSLRMGDVETIWDWFLRVVNHFGDVAPFQIEENMACFVVVGWASQTINYINFQVVLSLEKTLEELYCDSSRADDLLYFRLDYDFSALGEVFSHPHPHLHFQARDAPRFCLGEIGTGNAILDYLDFLYRNFYHAKWQRWAESVVARFDHDPKHDGEFSRVESAYKQSEHESLVQNHSAYLGKIKQALRVWKDKKYPLRIDTGTCEIIGY